VLQWLDTAAKRGTWRTSLDLPLQTELEAESAHGQQSLGSRVREAALVVIDNATGELLAWVGSPDFWLTRQVRSIWSSRRANQAPH